MGLTAKHKTKGEQGVVPGPATSATPGNMSEIQMIRLHPKLTESKTLGVGLILILKSESHRTSIKD